MGRDLHWTLDCLPPHLRAQAARKLGLDQPASAPVQSTNVFVVPNSTPPEGSQQPRRRRGGLYKANTLSNAQNAPQTLPAPSPAGFKSIAEARVEKKAVKRRKTLTPDMAGSLVKSCKTSPDGNEVRIVLNIDSYQLPTAQQKGAFVGKDNRVHFFTKAKVAKAEKALIKTLSPYAALVNKWGEVPIALDVDFCFSFPKSTPKKEIIHFAYHKSRPDLDNIIKAVLDSLTQSNFWKDDSLIADLHLKKYRVVTDPTVTITIRKLDDMNNSNSLFSVTPERFFKDVKQEERCQ